MFELLHVIELDERKCRKSYVVFSAVPDPVPNKKFFGVTDYLKHTLAWIKLLEQKTNTIHCVIGLLGI